MSEYQITLFQGIYGSDEEFPLELCEQIILPFMPTPFMGLGLYPDSDFQTAERRIDRVMWHAPLQRFYVRLENFHGCPQSVAKDLLSNG
jgi:hypothetical protein